MVAVIGFVVVAAGLGAFYALHHDSKRSPGSSAQSTPGALSVPLASSPPINHDLNIDLIGLGQAEYRYQFAHHDYTDDLASLKQDGFQQSGATAVDIWVGTTTAGQGGYCLVGSAGGRPPWAVNAQTSTGVSVINTASTVLAGEADCQDRSIANFLQIIPAISTPASPRKTSHVPAALPDAATVQPRAVDPCTIALNGQRTEGVSDPSSTRGRSSGGVRTCTVQNPAVPNSVIVIGVEPEAYANKFAWSTSLDGADANYYGPAKGVPWTEFDIEQRPTSTLAYVYIGHLSLVFYATNDTNNDDLYTFARGALTNSFRQAH